MTKILETRNLTKYYPIRGGVLRREVSRVHALDGVDLEIFRGECLGVVGESGCGKTTLGKTLIRFHSPSGGAIHFTPAEGTRCDIAQMPNRKLKQKNIRGRLQMVFQDPTTSLNPRMLVKNIVAEPLRTQGSIGGRPLYDRVLNLLDMVGLTDDHLLRYPHEFSGGQRQRIAVARAVATDPDFIVLDEPTSALDVSVQAQILNLLKRLQKKMGLTYLFVTHHLLVVRYMSDRVAVMYLGKIVEIADTQSLFEAPCHPYTYALLSGIPIPEVDHPRKKMVLTGDVPSPVHPPDGCRFHTRCPFAIDICRKKEPVLETTRPGHRAACHRKHEISGLIASDGIVSG